MDRRDFLQAATVGGAGVLTGCASDSLRLGDAAIGGDGNAARLFFEGGGNVQPGVSRLAVARYNQGKEQLRALWAEGKGRSFEELNQVVTVPFVDVLRQGISALRQQETARKLRANAKPVFENGGFQIPPGAELQVVTKGHCMDPTKPAPTLGHAITLLPLGNRVASPLIPLLSAIGANTGKKGGLTVNDGQALTWAIVGAGTRSPWTAKVTPALLGRLNSVCPGGARVFQDYHQQEMLKRAALDAVLSAANLSQFVSADDLLGGRAPDAVVEKTLNQLVSQGQRVSDGRGKGFSTLAPGVYAEGQGVGPLVVSYRIANSSPDVHIYRPVAFYGQPSAKLQPVLGTHDILQSGLRNLVQLPATAFSNLSQSMQDLIQDLSKFVGEKVWGGFWNNLGRDSPVGKQAIRGASGLLKFTPVVGNLLSMYEALTGKNWMTQEDLGNVDRLLSLVGSIPGANTLRGIGAGLGEASLFFRLVDKTEGVRDVVNWAASNTANNLAPNALSQYNKATEGEIQRWLTSSVNDIPWASSTRKALMDVVSGRMQWGGT